MNQKKFTAITCGPECKEFKNKVLKKLLEHIEKDNIYTPSGTEKFCWIYPCIKTVGFGVSECMNTGVIRVIQDNKKEEYTTYYGYNYND